MKLSKISELLGAKHQGVDVDVEHVSTDSRSIQPGELFVALVGPTFNGHAFIADAYQRGAVAAMVSEDNLNMDSTLPLLKVADTRIGLGQLAKIKREMFSIPVIAVTGSCGKTTTKSLVASILSQRDDDVLATKGTLNNDIGLPLTLLRLTSQHRFAVVELGANHLKEIAYIADIAKPTVAVITNAAPVHLEGFHNLDGVAQGKGEIYQALDPEGIAILNADDVYANYWRTLIGKHRCLTFGLTQAANVQARDIVIDQNGYSQFVLVTSEGETLIHLPLLGRHNVMNALAAAAVTYAIGFSLTEIKTGLEKATPDSKRLVMRKGLNGARIIDDTYNANPQAFSAAIAVLMQQAPGEKILVMSDMAELGINEEYYHQQLGQEAHDKGIDRLYAIGSRSHHTVQSFGKNAEHFATQEELVAAVQQHMHANTTILVKGSRSFCMEKVVEALIEKNLFTH